MGRLSAANVYSGENKSSQGARVPVYRAPRRAARYPCTGRRTACPGKQKGNAGRSRLQSLLQE